MSIWKQIGVGIAPPEPTIEISNIRLFKIAADIAADEDDIRCYLSYLLIDPIAKTLASSNGFSCISTPDALDFSGYQGTKKILIKPESKLPKDCTAAVINFKTKVIHAYRAKLPILRIYFETLDYKYPDLTEIFAGINETTKTQVGCIAFNPKLLRKMHKQSGSQSVFIVHHQTPKGPMYSVKFSNLDAEYTAILMPVRI